MNSWTFVTTCQVPNGRVNRNEIGNRTSRKPNRSRTPAFQGIRAEKTQMLPGPLYEIRSQFLENRAVIGAVASADRRPKLPKPKPGVETTQVSARVHALDFWYRATRPSQRLCTKKAFPDLIGFSVRSVAWRPLAAA